MHFFLTPTFKLISKRETNCLVGLVLCDITYECISSFLN